MPRKRHWMTRSLFATALALGLTPGAAQATTDVGVAAAVNPDAFSHFGGATEQVVIGKTIVYNERINTSTKGLVQVLFVDGSTVTVGPGSDLVIDKFVYDPAKGKGELTASFTKGMLRFVGGKLSKRADAVKFKTPVGTLGIRGGMFQGRVGGGESSFSFLFGEEMSFTGSNGQTNRVFQANNTLVVGGPGGGAPTVRPTRAEDAAFFVSNLSGQGGPGGGATGPSDQQVQGSGIGGANSGNNQGGPTFNNPFNTTPVNNNLTEQSTTDVIRNSFQNQDQGGSTAPSNVLKLRVLLPGGAFLALVDTGAVVIDDPGDSGILGGDNDPVIQTDDFITTASLVNGRATATVQGLIDNLACDDCEPEYGTIEPHTFNFPFTTQPDVHEISLADNATIVSRSESMYYTGSLFVAPDSGFYVYRLFETSFDGEYVEVDYGEQILAFGGTPYTPPANTGAGKLREFTLFTDPTQDNIPLPFASAASTPYVFDEETDQYVVDPNATVSRLFLLEQDTGRPGQVVEGDPSKSVWLQTSFSMTGEGTDQQSSVVIAAGTAVQQNGKTALVGERRGSSQIMDDYPAQRTTNFTGGISTLAGPEGNHLFGNTAPSFVIGADSTDTHNIFTDEPIDLGDPPPDNLSGATYHIGTQREVSAAPAQTTATYYGYAAGLMQTRDPLGSPPNALATQAAPETGELDFFIQLNAEANTLGAKAVLNDVQGTDELVRDYSLLFGTGEDGAGGGISAYIDDDRFAAFETLNESGASQVFDDSGTAFNETKAETYIVSGGLLNNEAIFGRAEVNTDSEGNVHAFCVQCDFIKWGAWGGKVGFGDESVAETNDFFHLGWWVAGNLTRNDQLDNLRDNYMAANYEGQAIGNVANWSRDGWQTYTARGDLDMYWNFNSRSGNLSINNFDTSQNDGAGYSFTSQISTPGAASINAFNGELSGAGMSGDVAGSFVNNGAKAAAGVIGNWNVGSPNYKAVGVFAGKGTPVPAPSGQLD